MAVEVPAVGARKAGRRRRLRLDLTTPSLLGLPLAWLGVFFFVPIAIVAAYSVDALSLDPGAHALTLAAWRDLVHSSVYLKLFKEIPKADIEMLLPGARLQMPGLTKLKMGGSLFGSLAWIVYQIMRTSDAVTHASGIWVTFGLIAGLYLALGITLVVVTHEPEVARVPLVREPVGVDPATARPVGGVGLVNAAAVRSRQHGEAPARGKSGRVDHLGVFKLSHRLRPDGLAQDRL